MTLKAISEAIDIMYPDLLVRTAVDPSNPETGNIPVTIGEWIRSAEDFPQERKPTKVHWASLLLRGKKRVRKSVCVTLTGILRGK